MCNLCNRYKASLERISQHAGSDIFAKIDTLLSENKRIQAISLYWGLHPEIGLLVSES